MKYLIFILLTVFSINCFGQTWEGNWLGKDKVLHFVYSSALSALCINTLGDINKKDGNKLLTQRQSEFIGASVAFTVGLSKEIFYDEHFSKKDLTVDFISSYSTIFINRFVNKQIQKFYKKKGW